MQRRAARWTLLIVLLLAAGGGGYVGAQVFREHEKVLASSAAVEASLTQMASLATDIGAAQATYIAAGVNPQPSIERVEMLARQLGDASTTIQPRLRSSEAPRHLQDLSNTLDNLVQIDLRARQEIVDGDERSAALLIFDDGRAAVVSMTGSIRALAEAERSAAASTRTELLQRLGIIAASVAGLWLFGLLLLVKSPRPKVITVEREVEREPAPPAFDLRLDDSVAQPASDAPPAASVAPPPAQVSTIDLSAAADVCTAIARAASSDQLPDLLARAAVVLDASGIILWLGAGDELFPATAHGYDPRLLSRLGPIPRDADNATAAAWRTGGLGIVPRDASSNGAIVAPLLGVDACIGVLAAEVRHGHEDDLTARAVATMFAAQLAAIVSAWPGAAGATGDATGGDSADPLAASL